MDILKNLGWFSLGSGLTFAVFYWMEATVTHKIERLVKFCDAAEANAEALKALNAVLKARADFMSKTLQELIDIYADCRSTALDEERVWSKADEALFAMWKDTEK